MCLAWSGSAALPTRQRSRSTLSSIPLFSHFLPLDCCVSSQFSALSVELIEKREAQRNRLIPAPRRMMRNLAFTLAYRDRQGQVRRAVGARIASRRLLVPLED